MAITIQESKQRLYEIQQAKLYVHEVEATLQQNKLDLKHAKLQLDKENEDVDDLRYLTFSYVQALLTNTKDMRMYKEKQEAIEAQLLYEQMCAKDKALRSEYRKLWLLIDEEEGVERKLDELQRDALAKHNSLKCIEIDDKISNNRAQDYKLKETIDTIQLIARRLDVALDHIDKAFLFDITLESGAFTKTAKHNMFMDIEDEIEAIRLDIMRLKEEFKTIRAYELSNLHIPLELVRQDFDRYNFLYFVQHKIHQNTRDEMRNIRAFQKQIEECVIDLRKQIVENNKRYEQLQDEYEHAMET